jgi:hypothetical protein
MINREGQKTTAVKPENEESFFTLHKVTSSIILILKAGPNMDLNGVEKIICEHGRRNFSLHEDGVL